MHDFPKDEMWYPTSWFKSGLAMEMLGSVLEAKMVYSDMVKKRGDADVWGSEAKKRLEKLQ
jgi:hypothetical protein